MNNSVVQEWKKKPEGEIVIRDSIVRGATGISMVVNMTPGNVSDEKGTLAWEWKTMREQFP